MFDGEIRPVAQGRRESLADQFPILRIDPSAPHLDIHSSVRGWGVTEEFESPGVPEGVA